jgi:thioredoxin reductase (NADPH)
MPENLRPDPLLLPRISSDQLDLLRRCGEVRATAVGDVLFRRGDAPVGLIVVTEGRVAIVDDSGETERELSVQQPGGFVGVLSAMTGQRAYVTAVVRDAGNVLIVPVSQLKQLVADDEALGDLILQLVFQRREALEGVRAGIRIVGSRYSPDTHRLREFATRNRVAHVWDELEQDTDADASLLRLGVEPQDTPVVLLAAGTVLRNPTNGELARAIGLRGGDPPATQTTYDVVIVGAGPAGLAAAVYGATSGLSVMALDAVAGGGQAATSARIENYLAFPSGLSGAEFAERSLIQAEKFGARLAIPTRAVALSEESGYHQLTLEDGDRLVARTVIIATGVQYRRLDVPHLEDYEGIGVAYTSAGAEHQLAPSESAIVVGGANSAGQAALSLTARGHHVFLVVRAPSLERTMARYLIDRIAREPAVEVIRQSELRYVHGDGRLERVTIEDISTGNRRTFEAGAMFILIGAEPHTQWLAKTLTLDDSGYVVTGPALGAQLRDAAPWNALGREPYLLETSRPGVFAAGDVRSDSVKRVATAAGEGSMAVRFAQEYLVSQGAAARAT